MEISICMKPSKQANNERRNKMEKFRVKVNLQEGETAGEITKAFFQDFCTENHIKVREKEVELEVHFQEVPMSIIEAISGYKDFELEYEKDLKENATLEQKNKPKKKVQNRKKTKTNTSITIPEIEEFAKQATSFQHFADLIVEWLEIKGTSKKVGKEFIMAAIEVEVIQWRNLKLALTSKNVVCTQYNEAVVKKSISNKCEKYSVTPVLFFAIVSQYKDYHFIGRQKFEMLSVPVNAEMEKALFEINRTRPIEERVFFMLKAMGVEEKEAGEKERIVQFAIEAVKKKNMAEDSLLTQNSFSRVAFSNFLNEYVSKNGGKEKVKALDFLQELQKVIIREDEL